VIHPSLRCVMTIFFADRTPSQRFSTRNVMMNVSHVTPVIHPSLRCVDTIFVRIEHLHKDCLHATCLSFRVHIIAICQHFVEIPKRIAIYSNFKLFVIFLQCVLSDFVYVWRLIISSAGLIILLNCELSMTIGIYSC